MVSPGQCRVCKKREAGSGSGDTDAGADGGSSPVDIEAHLLEYWAYGTSPYGLGLDERKVWTISIREYNALKKVHQDHVLRTHAMYAGLMATLHNAHFKHPRGESERFQMADFMPGGRAPQTAEEKAAIFSAQMEAVKESFRSKKRAASPAPETIPAIVALRNEKRRLNKS